MARKATIIDQVLDIDSRPYDVREYRATEAGFSVAIGWPEGHRGRGCGGPRVILTQGLADYLRKNKCNNAISTLPVGRTVVKRLRKILGLNHYALTEQWWSSRLHDLMELTGADFVAKHGKTEASACLWRQRFGLASRQGDSGYYLEGKTLELLLAPLPHAYVADRLGKSLSTIYRLRWMLRCKGHKLPIFRGGLTMPPQTRKALSAAISKPKPYKHRLNLALSHMQRIEYIYHARIDEDSTVEPETAERYHAIIAMWCDGWSIRQICDELGYTFFDDNDNTVYHVLRRFKIPRTVTHFDPQQAELRLDKKISGLPPAPPLPGNLAKLQPGERVSYFRKQANISRPKLAKLAGINANTAQAIEYNKVSGMTRETAEALAVFFDIPVAWLLAPAILDENSLEF